MSPSHLPSPHAGSPSVAASPSLPTPPMPPMHIVLFGAGHVGHALVTLLGHLPCVVQWVDERDECFPDEVPGNVQVEATDTPEVIVDRAPAGAYFIVMTHNHALDFTLTERIMKRRDVAWFGLIGSKTKRVKFERRLVARGLNPAWLAEIVCPIGVPGIVDKAPASIAVAVCAQLMQVRCEAAAKPVPTPVTALPAAPPAAYYVAQ